MEVIEETCSHIYSRGINEPRPRLCINCGEPEVCLACQGEGEIHMCGKPIEYPTLGEHIVEFMEGNNISDRVIQIRYKMGGKVYVHMSEVLANFHEFLSTRKVRK